MSLRPADIALISAVLESRGSGSGGPVGVADHQKLSGRDAAGQHPIKAITGLEEILEGIPRPMTAEELQKILNGGTNDE